MMGVYIKGMKMPKDCENCPMLDDNGDYPTCILTWTSQGYNWSPIGQRMPDCPLVEFSPPRGEWTDVSEKVWVSEIGFTSAWECSNCHTIFPFYSNYCPNCGAKMAEDGE